MQQVIEKEINLPQVSVQLATVRFDATEEFIPQFSAYYNICQRLSDKHSPMRIGNLAAREAFPRVRSVGFLPPGCSFKLFPLEQPFRALNCAFEKTFFEEATRIQQNLWEEHTGALVSIKERRLETIMQQIYAELVQPGFAQELMIEALTTTLLVEMARYARRLGTASGPGGTGHGMAPWQLRRIQERIEASLELGYPGLEELAQLAGISQSHLMRTFKVSTGWQIHKYIAEERMKSAKLLLAEDQLNTKEISTRLGFRSPAYFATAFLRMTGMTPTEYRRQARAVGLGSA